MLLINTASSVLSLSFPCLSDKEFLSDGAQRHSPQQVGLHLSSLTLAGWGRATPGLSRFFPNRLLVGGAAATLSLSYDSVPLPGHSKGTLYTQYWFCSGGDKLCLPTSQLEYCWLHSFQTLLPALLVQWGPPDQSGLSYVSVHVLGQDRERSIVFNQAFSLEGAGS